MDLRQQLMEKRDEVLRIARRHGVERVWVFGSVARGEATEQSDIDFLLDVRGPTPPWFPGGLLLELEALLGRRVDLVEPAALREPMREQVWKEAVLL